MWINSPSGKWDQDVLVEKALGGAERRRVLEAGQGAWEESGIGGFLRCSIPRLALRVAPDVHQAADALRSMLGTPLPKERQPQRASRS